MPIYEYKCGSCEEISSYLIRSIPLIRKLTCSYCSSNRLARVMSAFAYHKSNVGNIESSLSNRDNSMDYYQNPENIGKNVEETFDQYGLQIPKSIEETISSARQGKLPQEIDLKGSS